MPNNRFLILFASFSNICQNSINSYATDELSIQQIPLNSFNHISIFIYYDAPKLTTSSNWEDDHKFAQ